jgi:hypothetical protein
MITRATNWFKSQWADFRQAPIGQRFQAFNRRQAQSTNRHPWLKPFIWTGGILLIAIGGFFALVPGPAFIFIIPGAAALAHQSLAVARVLDWFDQKSRPLILAVQRIWNCLSPKAQRNLKILMCTTSVFALVAGFFIKK